MRSLNHLLMPQGSIMTTIKRSDLIILKQIVDTHKDSQQPAVFRDVVLARVLLALVPSSDVLQSPRPHDESPVPKRFPDEEGVWWHEYDGGPDYFTLEQAAKCDRIGPWLKITKPEFPRVKCF